MRNRAGEGPAPRWADAHCHLDDEPDPERVLAEARSGGVELFITVGTDAARSRTAIDLAARHDDVWATVGLHPHDAAHGVDTVAGLVGAPKVVAVGEAGLDYHYEHSPRAAQKEAFTAQIGLARERGLPLVIHTREAWDDTFAILQAEGPPETTIFHCFTGGRAEARRCLDLGAYLSFSGIVTFRNADDNREAAALCPLDRLLVETDSPFLAPVPHRGRRNQPGLVAVVGAAVAAIRRTAMEDVARATLGNTRVAFRLPQP